MMRSSLTTLAREPLVHFLLLGAAIFAAYALMSESGSGEPGRIVITQGQLASMRETFTRTRQRLPTPEEWEGMIRDRVREEVYYREALALALDKDDIIIRRRLRQKMEFVSDDNVPQDPPTDDDLNAYLQAHPDEFRVEQQFTFRQLYLNPEKHGGNAERDAAQLLAKLNQAGGDTGFAAMGDPFLLDNSFTAMAASEVARQFGDTFTAQLRDLQLGQWQGPVESGYGVHLVLISERTEGGAPSLADVRDAVRREWESTRRKEANEKLYQDLLKHYTVTIEAPLTAGEEDMAVAK
jgi:hypothetical protein